jgi:hypothetical protein
MELSWTWFGKSKSEDIQAPTARLITAKFYPGGKTFFSKKAESCGPEVFPSEYSKYHSRTKGPVPHPFGLSLAVASE